MHHLEIRIQCREDAHYSLTHFSHAYIVLKPCNDWEKFKCGLAYFSYNMLVPSRFVGVLVL